jgi:hypothetical protein
VAKPTMKIVRQPKPSSSRAAERAR